MDLSQGNIFSQLIIFALPLLAGQLFQSLYNSVDSIVIGNFEDANALAAVTASATISLILSGFFNGMSAGATAMFARLFGAKDHNNLHRAIQTTVLFSVLLGIILSALGIIFTPALLEFTSCPPEVFELAVSYLRIYLIGVLFTSIYNIGAGVLRSVGDSQSPFIFLVISSVMNIFLDLLFVAAFHMGVSGVAIATIISQCVSMVLVFIKMMRMDGSYRFSFKEIIMDWSLLGEVARLGFPAGLQTSLTAISNLYVQQYINSFSAVAIAGVGSAMKVDQFAGMFCFTLGLAMTTFIGQNLGAGRNDRAHKAVGVSALSCAVFVLIVCIPIYIYSPYLIRIFSPDMEVIMYGTGMLRVIMPLYLIMGMNGLFGGILRGFRYSITSMICTLAGMVAVRQIWLYVTLTYFGHDIRFVYYGYPIGWICSLTPMLLIYFLHIRRKYPSKQ
mgnify:CR=1 FL=1